MHLHLIAFDNVSLLDYGDDLFVPNDHVMDNKTVNWDFPPLKILSSDIVGDVLSLLLF